MDELEPGALLAERYRIEARIGRGGFGAVYRALDGTTGALVAVKYLHRAQLLSTAVTRFEREATFLMSLHHPKIVRAIDFGYTGEVPYLVCELLEGLPLDALLEAQGAMTTSVAAAIALDVLDALGAAHAAGIVHRDVKPSNIFLPSPGTSGPARLIDFGIAHSLSPGVGELKLTSTGDAIGTPAYVAPEQAYGRPVSPRTDLYAFGLTLAEMVGGARLVAGESALEMLMTHGDEGPHELPDRVRQSPLCAVIERAVAKSPEARYASADEMARAIRALVRPARRGQTLAIGLHTEISLVAHGTGGVISATLADTAGETVHQPFAPATGRSPARAVPGPVIPHVPRQPAPQSSAGRTMLWAVVAIAAIAAVVVVIALATRDTASERSASRKPRASGAAETPRAKRSAIADVPRQPRGLSTVDLVELRKRVEGAGYVIDTAVDSPSDLASVNAHIFAKRGAAVAEVRCTRFIELSYAVDAPDILRSEGYAAHREAEMVLSVRIPDDAAASNALLEELR